MITGASGGIGRAIGVAFAEAGWFVGVHYHREKQAAEATLSLVNKAGGSGAIYQADIRDSSPVRSMVEAFYRDAPGITAVVCNAGIGCSTLLLRQRETEWADVINTNLSGTFYCLQAAAPHLSARGGGSIVIVGSHAGFQGSGGQAAYAASKAGLIGLMKTAALEWGPDNIRVNLVLPGWQKTRLSEDSMPNDDAWLNHALRRPPALQEVIKTIMRMAECQDVSGQVWNCDSRHLR